MANLFFPQLLTGSMAQYPIRKLKQFRSVMNVYADNSITAWPDSAVSSLTWQLQYTGISATELNALQTLFAQCAGPLRPFTFIDPTGNMLLSSSDFTNGAWTADPGCSITGGASDPFGGQAAFTINNSSQVSAGLSQGLSVPANYQYCFSVYVRAEVACSVTLAISGQASSQSQDFTAHSSWTRVAMAVRLNDPGTSLSVALRAVAGSHVQLCGPQLEAQTSPSGYRPTGARGAVYANCHWTNSVLPMTALGPNVFATEVGIETLL